MSKITTIIPTYRRPELLKKSIDSVLKQTMSDFQVCVYDNASGDGTGEVVADLMRKDARVKYHAHPENIGMVANFQHGLERVDTPYFCFFSDDDLVLPHFYATAIAALERYPEAAFFAGSAIHVDEHKRLIHAPFTKYRQEYYTPEETIFEIIGQEFTAWTSIVFRREVIERIGGLDERMVMMFDSDFLLRIMTRLPIVVSDKVCAIFSLHKAGFSSSLRLSYVWPSWDYISQKICRDEHLTFRQRVHLEKQFDRSLKQVLSTIAVQALKRKDFAEAEQTAGMLSGKFLFKQITKLCKRFVLFYLIFMLALDLRRLIIRTVRHHQLRMRKEICLDQL